MKPAKAVAAVFTLMCLLTACNPGMGVQTSVRPGRSSWNYCNPNKQPACPFPE